MTAQVYIIYYSCWGHVAKLAKAVKKGVDSVEGVKGVLWQVAETLPPELLEKIHAAPKDEDVPIITADKLPEADGLIFGLPTRFGSVASQVKAFMDSTGGLWQSGGLHGKPGGVFVSVGTQGGGMETTALTFATHFAHHGMPFIPAGYAFGAKLFGTDEVRGGSPWGPGTFAGATGARQPTETELEFAEHYGAYFASVVYNLKTRTVRSRSTEAEKVERKTSSVPPKATAGTPPVSAPPAATSVEQSKPQTAPAAEAPKKTSWCCTS